MIEEILENGVRVVLSENHFAPTVAIQAWVGAGSMHEKPEERGMAHFLEHMLFKGTPRHGVGEIASTVEGYGGEINAYTTFDHTVFHLTLAAPHALKGVDLLCDAFGYSSLDPEEFGREREVILEEIRRGNDSPGGLVGRRVFELAFAGSEAGRAIIGSEDSVRSFSRDSVASFYRRWYQPANLTLLVVGDIEPVAMMAEIKRTFGGLKADAKQALPPQPAIQVKFGQKDGQAVSDADADWPRVSIIRGDYQQPRAEVVFPSPNFEHFDSPALDLAAFALGSGEMSRFNRRLRDGEGSVTSVGATVYSPAFGGLFELSALMEPDLLLRAVQSLARETAVLHGKDPVTEEELARARANVKAQRLYQEETVDGRARAIGFGMRTSQKYLYEDVFTAQLNAMPARAVGAAVRHWLDPKQAVIVILVHNDTPLTEAEVKKAFRAGVAEGFASPSKIAAASTAKVDRAHADVVQLLPGLTLVHRHNPAVELFTMTAATEGGQRAETAGTAGMVGFLAEMLGLASKGRTYDEMIGTIENLGASLEGFSGKDSFGFTLQCLTEQAATVLDLFRGCFFEPVPPAEQLQSLKREALQTLKAQDDSPASVAARTFREMIYGDHPYRYPVIGTAASVGALTPAGLTSAYHEIQSSGPWTFAVTSTLPTARVVELVKAAVAGFAPRAARRIFPCDSLRPRSEVGHRHLSKSREQTHIIYGFPGITWGDPDRAALDVLVDVLGGHGGRLFRSLRDRDSLAYTVSPLITYGCHPGMLGSYIACAPEKGDRALAALAAEMDALVHSAPTKVEVERARSHLIGTHDMGLQKSDGQTSTMALMEVFGFGYDDFLTYPKRVAAVTTDQVQAVAARLIRKDLAAAVSVGPQTVKSLA